MNIQIFGDNLALCAAVEKIATAKNHSVKINSVNPFLVDDVYDALENTQAVFCINTSFIETLKPLENLINASIEKNITHFFYISTLNTLENPKEEKITAHTKNIPDRKTVHPYTFLKYNAELEAFRGEAEGIPNVKIFHLGILEDTFSVEKKEEKNNAEKKYLGSISIAAAAAKIVNTLEQETTEKHIFLVENIVEIEALKSSIFSSFWASKNTLAATALSSKKPIEL